MPELKDFKVGDKIDVVASVMKYDTTLELSISSASDITKAGQAEANDVVAKIDSLPATLTLADAQKVSDARNAYNALNDETKKLVTNLTKLTSAEDTIAKLQEDKTASDAVIGKINAISTSVTLTDAQKVTDARKAYDSLSDDQKKLVSNLSALTSAEDKLKAMQNTTTNPGNNNNNNTNTNAGSANTNNSSTSTSGSSNQTISSIPKTGAIIGTGVLLAIGVALIGAGIVVIRKNKNQQVAE